MICSAIKRLLVWMRHILGVLLVRFGIEWPTIPVSVNYHFTRQCNYSCGFCFHTALTSFVLPMDEAKRGLAMLKEAGMEKINFSGGEPFIYKGGKYLGELVVFCKQELKLSVSIVTNGSLVKEEWFEEFADSLDILAVSCDSFNASVNAAIGRRAHSPRDDHVDKLRLIRRWCDEHGVAFKINTVVNSQNKDENMVNEILELSPMRWKVFQCLLIDGENAGANALRRAEDFIVSDEDFQRFLDRHTAAKVLVPENNERMRNSYLILDEYMRFLDNTGGQKTPSRSILDVGVNEALKFAGFDEKMFLQRGGEYKWSKRDMNLTW